MPRPWTVSRRRLCPMFACASLQCGSMTSLSLTHAALSELSRAYACTTSTALRAAPVPATSLRLVAIASADGLLTAALAQERERALSTMTAPQRLAAEANAPIGKWQRGRFVEGAESPVREDSEEKKRSDERKQSYVLPGE